jgi:hypothetical protein
VCKLRGAFGIIIYIALTGSLVGQRSHPQGWLYCVYGVQLLQGATGPKAKRENDMEPKVTPASEYQCAPPDVHGNGRTPYRKSAGVIAREAARAKFVAPEPGALEAFWAESPIARGVMKSDLVDEE